MLYKTNKSVTVTKTEKEMNANELADMAEYACCAYHKEIATMLRQQQAEIEALKEELDDIKQYNMDRNLSE